VTYSVGGRTGGSPVPIHQGCHSHPLTGGVDESPKPAVQAGQWPAGGDRATPARPFLGDFDRFSNGFTL